VRLAFAVAAHLDPEILIVDEVLAVGDAEFQKKCLGKMGDVAGEGRTVLFVSHNMQAVQNLCRKSVLLTLGKISKISDSESVITEYLSNTKLINRFSPDEKERLGDHRIKVIDFKMDPLLPRTGQPMKCTLEVLVDNHENVNFTADYSISFMTDRGYKIFQLHSGHVEKGIIIDKRKSRVITEIDALPLTPGRYSINLRIGSGSFTYDWIPEAYTFDVDTGSMESGILIDNRGYPVIMPSKWKTE